MIRITFKPFFSAEGKHPGFIYRCRYVPPQWVGFLHRFGLKTGIDFAHFGLDQSLESGVVNKGTSVSMCSSFQFQMNKKESVICEFEMDIKNSFCCGFNFSNDDIISVLCRM